MPKTDVVIPEKLPEELMHLVDANYNYTIIKFTEKKRLRRTNCGLVVYGDAHRADASVYDYDGKLVATYEGKDGRHV